MAEKQTDDEQERRFRHAVIERLGPYDPCLPMQWATMVDVIELMKWAAEPEVTE